MTRTVIVAITGTAFGALTIALAVAAGSSDALPPYPSSFNIAWDEEVQVAPSESVWVHRVETYARRSKLSRWDARKVSETLLFAPTRRIGTFSARLDLGGFFAIDRQGDDWVVLYGGADLAALDIGACNPSGTQCAFFIKPDGVIYKPQNRSEVVDNFE